MLKIRITTYPQAFDLINVRLMDKVIEKLKFLERQGYSERSICYAIWNSQDKIRRFRGDNRFWSVLYNEVYKCALKNGDPRWDEIMRRKRDIEAIKQREKLQKQREIAEAKAEKYRKQKDLQEKRTALCVLIDDPDIKHKKLNSFVYFIQGENGGPIKIGLSQDVKKRLYALQIGHPDNLVVLVDIPGDEVVELEMHKKFDDCRLRGEWFKPTDRLLAFIKSIKKSKLALVEGGKQE